MERFVVRDRPGPGHRLRALRGGVEFAWPAGIYSRLRHRETVLMTDTPDEWLSHRSPIREATARGGEVLVTGLGLGCVVEAMLELAGRRLGRVTVVERSEDVLRLVGSYLETRHGGRVEIVHGDAFRWSPPSARRYSVGWHDIWADPRDADCRFEMERLEARYARCCDWQGSWPREYLRAEAEASGSGCRDAGRARGTGRDSLNARRAG